MVIEVRSMDYSGSIKLGATEFDVMLDVQRLVGDLPERLQKTLDIENLEVFIRRDNDIFGINIHAVGPAASRHLAEATRRLQVAFGGDIDYPRTRFARRFIQYAIWPTGSSER